MTASLGLIGGMGMPELLVILVIALLIFGAGRIPEIARSLGKAISEFKKATREDADDASKRAAGQAKNDK